MRSKASSSAKAVLAESIVDCNRAAAAAASAAASAAAAAAAAAALSNNSEYAL
jgi:hypothetical protein